MTPTEAQMLLTITASYDNRKPDPDVATAWSVILGDLNFTDCRTAIVEHYTRSREWLMPVDIIAAVRKIRDKRLADAPPMVPPPEMSVAEELEWRRREIKRIGDGLPPSAETRILVSRGEVVLPVLPSPEPVTRAQRDPQRQAKRAAVEAELRNRPAIEIPTHPGDHPGAVESDEKAGAV